MDIPATSLRPTAPPAQSSGARGQRTLLIVDDDEGVRRSLELVFAEIYDVLLAESGAKALELLQVHPVDVAILDIRMADMSGIELLEKIKRLDPSIEALMLTGYETIETIRLALRLGACDYLSKPFDTSTIRTAVTNAMERRTLSDEIRSTHVQMAALQVELQQQALREESTRNRGEIYASVLHDINSPLTVIAGYVELINMELEGAHQLDSGQIDTLKDHVRLINRQVTQCVEISRRYLGFLKHKPSEQTAIQLKTVLKDLQSLLAAHPSAKNQDFEIEPGDQDHTLLINGTDLIQILLNLAVNGFQSTSKPHRVKVWAESTFPQPEFDHFEGAPNHCVVVSNKFDPSRRFVRLYVEDDGPGIAPEILSKIFEPFFSTKGAAGTGLGLSIVQRLMNDAGGAIHVHSEQGRGTVFSLLIPAL